MNTFNSLIIGIVSGVISSLLITIFYRRIDAERERIVFFTDANKITSQFLVLDPNNIEAMYNFIEHSTLPKIYKWSPLSRDEKTLIHLLNLTLHTIRSEIVEYSVFHNIEESTLMADIQNARMHIVDIHNDISVLERAYFKRKKPKVDIISYFS